MKDKNNHKDSIDAPRRDMNDENFWEQVDEDFDKFHKERHQNEEQFLEEKKQKFLKIADNYKDWKIRITLSASDLYVLARVLCRSFSVDNALQRQHKTIYTCKEEKDLAHTILDKLLLSFRRSSSHLKDRSTHPDYREEKWHGTGEDIIMNIKEAFEISDKHLDADFLLLEYQYLTIGPEQYRKNMKRVLNETLKEVKKNGSVYTRRNAKRSKRKRK